MIKPKGVKGIYWCDFRTSDGKRRVRQSLHTTDKQEAKLREAKLISESEEHAKHRRVGGITLAEAFKHALRVRDTWRSAKSLHSIYQVYGMVEKHFGPSCYLSELDDECLLEYGEQLHDEGLTASTINKRLSLIAVLFDEAIQWNKYTGRKPNSVRYKVKNGRRRLISPSEEAQAINLCLYSANPYENAMADLIMVLADTGLRLSEALGIQPRHVHLDSRAVLVVDTKTGEDRVVPLTDRTLEVLARRTEAPIFQPLNPSVISHIWRRIRRKMGLEHEHEFVLHAFRHTFGSTLANAGMDAFRIQKVMGHKVIATTQRYVKVATSSLDGVADIMQTRYAQNHAQSGQKEGNSGIESLGE